MGDFGLSDMMEKQIMHYFNFLIGGTMYHGSVNF